MRHPLRLRPSFSLTVALALLLGLAGALLGERLRLPGGAFTGALLLAALARLAGAPLAEPPEWLQVAARAVLGLAIGAALTPATMRTIAASALPIAIVVLAITLLGILVARAIHRLTRMPMATALCAATPGVLSAMVALARDLDADARLVASMHLVRLLSILFVVPALVRGFFAPAGVGVQASPLAIPTPAGAPWRLAVLLVLGLAAGAAAHHFRLPAGDLLVALVVAAVANPLGLRLPDLPDAWTLFAEWIVGVAVGATVTRATLRDFRPFALAGAIMTAFLILAGLALAWLLAAVTSLDLATCVIGCSPGGAAALIILGRELGANAQIVAAMHISRQIVLVLILPALAKVARGGRATQRTPRAAGG